MPIPHGWGRLQVLIVNVGRLGRRLGVRLWNDRPPIVEGLCCRQTCAANDVMKAAIEIISMRTKRMFGPQLQLPKRWKETAPNASGKMASTPTHLPCASRRATQDPGAKEGCGAAAFRNDTRAAVLPEQSGRK